MPLHIIKLAVGAETVEDLAAWQASRLAHQAGTKSTARLVHTTHQTPKRKAEVLDGGSIYWVVKGVISVRQRIIDFDTGTKDDGKSCCLIVLDPKLVLVRPKRRRPFQGWRYLKPEAVPPDMTGADSDDAAKMPVAMRRELAELGLL